jgi:hypothetical protein
VKRGEGMGRQGKRRRNLAPKINSWIRLWVILTCSIRSKESSIYDVRTEGRGRGESGRMWTGGGSKQCRRPHSFFAAQVNAVLVLTF